MSRTLHGEHRIHHQDAKGTKCFLCDVLAILVPWLLFWVDGVAETGFPRVSKNLSMISCNYLEIRWMRDISCQCWYLLNCVW